MPIFNPKFFSIVFLGSQNPQILNHDFLINNKILPIEKEPFKSLMEGASQGNPPFTQYISTPLVTTLTYKWISIIIEQNRYQIKDTHFNMPLESPIISILRGYFGRMLRHTPLTLGGINFGGNIVFSDAEDETIFDENMGINRQKFQSRLGLVKAQYSPKIRLVWGEEQDGQFELSLKKSKSLTPIGTCAVNFNFEFFYKDMPSFLEMIDETGEVHDRFYTMLKKLDVEIKK
jgi:hypothetical protein